jgi:hypothetical protein
MLAIKAIINPRKLFKYIVNPHIAFKILAEPFLDAKLRGVSTKKLNYQFISALSDLAKLSNTKFSPVPIKNFIEKNFIESNYSDSNSMELKYLFNKFGSDKASIHKYYFIYQLILDELAINSQEGELVKIFEIGLGTNNLDVPSNMGIEGKPGASLRAFSAYLPKSIIHGADIDRRVLFNEGNIETFWVDQLSDESLAKVFDKKNQYDLIIDDGLHTPAANLKTLAATTQAVRLGGYIVVEDIGNDSTVINYWNVVKKILSNSFECELVDCEAALMFVAKRKR